MLAPFLSLASQLLDLARAALGGVGGDPLQPRDPFLQPAALALQALILAAQQLDLAGRIGMLVLVAHPRPFILQRIAVAGAESTGGAPVRGSECGWTAEGNTC